MYSSCKIWKKSIDNASILNFFTTLDLIWPKFYPQRPHLLYFSLADFHWNMLGYSINTVLQYISSEKKFVKYLKNCFFGTSLYNKGVIMGHTQNKKQFFFTEITKQKQIINFQKPSKYNMFWQSYEYFSILSDVFCQKSVIAS